MINGVGVVSTNGVGVISTNEVRRGGDGTGEEEGPSCVIVEV